MSVLVGWALAVAAIAVGYAVYGWPGVVLAFSVIVFWLLLQFSRSLRVLRMASGNPVGAVPSAVMFNAKLQKGMRLRDVLQLTRSLGRRIVETDTDETWAWADAGGDEVQVHLHGGRVTAWNLSRSEAPAA